MSEVPKCIFTEDLRTLNVDFEAVFLKLSEVPDLIFSTTFFKDFMTLFVGFFSKTIRGTNLDFFQKLLGLETWTLKRVFKRSSDVSLRTFRNLRVHLWEDFSITCRTQKCAFLYKNFAELIPVVWGTLRRMSDLLMWIFKNNYSKSVRERLGVWIKIC